MTLRMHANTTTARAVAGAVAGAALLGFGVPTAVQAVGSDPSTGLSNTQLTQMREEERMARDLYTQLAASSGEAIFTRIAGAEQRHLDAVERLMTSQGMNPEAAGSTVGRYADVDLQSAYTGWLASGSASDHAAYEVGVALEKRDIADLKAVPAAPGTPAFGVVAMLLAGSEHHLAAFTKAVNGDLATAGSRTGMGHGGPGNNASRACPYEERGDGQRGYGPGVRQGRGMGSAG